MGIRILRVDRSGFVEEGLVAGLAGRRHNKEDIKLKRNALNIVCALALLSWSIAAPGVLRAESVLSSPLSAAADPSPPPAPIRLAFIHHSVGDDWLSQTEGDLGSTLGANNYSVSDTHCYWGPDDIGSSTDIGNW